MKVEDFKKLSEPFSPDDIEWRIARSGMTKAGKPWAQVLAYITSRAVQDRLDEVCGPDGWQTEITKIDDAYLCKMSIRIDYPDGRQVWISKTDGADTTNVEAVKGAISTSIKRAAVQFKIGRYLYDLKDNFAVISDNGKFKGECKDKDGKKVYFSYDPPKLPEWALPGDVVNVSFKKNETKPEVEKETPAAPKATTLVAAGDSKELTQALLTVNDYISHNLLKPAWVPRARECINTKDLEGLKKLIALMEPIISNTINQEAEQSA